MLECFRGHSRRGSQNRNPPRYERAKRLQGCVVLSKLGTPLFDAMSLVYDHEKNTTAPSGLFEECRESTIAETHLRRCQNDPVKFFLQVLLVW